MLFREAALSYTVESAFRSCRLPSAYSTHLVAGASVEASGSARWCHTCSGVARRCHRRRAQLRPLPAWRGGVPWASLLRLDRDLIEEGAILRHASPRRRYPEPAHSLTVSWWSPSSADGPSCWRWRAPGAGAAGAPHGRGPPPTRASMSRRRQPAQRSGIPLADERVALSIGHLGTRTTLLRMEPPAVGVSPWPCGLPWWLTHPLSGVRIAAHASAWRTYLAQAAVAWPLQFWALCGSVSARQRPRCADGPRGMWKGATPMTLGAQNSTRDAAEADESVTSAPRLLATAAH